MCACFHKIKTIKTRDSINILFFYISDVSSETSGFFTDGGKPRPKDGRFKRS